MTAIIIGINGQDGHYMNALLKTKNINVIGVSRSGPWLRTDISKFNEVAELINQYKPDYLFNFAANSSMAHEALFENHDTISTGSLNILEAVKTISPHTKVFFSGSGLQFVNNGVPIKETDAFMPANNYCVNRIQSAYIARYYRTLGVKVYFGYFFHHESPLRQERFISKKITNAVQRIAKGSDEKIIIRDIDVSKEWTFAGDIVEGIFTLVQQDQIFEANISSGEVYTIKEWLMTCFDIIGKNWRDYYLPEQNPASNYKILISDPSLIFSLGWRPKTSIRELAKMMLEWKH
jgi:GDPmannose 4,6-dehydratase